MQNKSALVVDDSRVARMTLAKQLKAHGFEIAEVGSGEEALAWLRQAANKPDVIFMDVMMEGMDGLTATREIKASPDWADIPVIICSGNDAQAELDQALATGADAVLSKPPAADKVATILNTIQTSTTAPTTPDNVVQAVDETALLTRLMTEFSSQQLPALQQSMRDMAEDISRQVAAEVAEQATQSKYESLLPTMMSSVTDKSMEALNDVTHQVEKSALKVVNLHVKKAVDQGIADYDMTDAVQQALTAQSADWLDAQKNALEQSLQAQLSQQLQQQIEADLTPAIQKQVQAYLTDELPAQVGQQVQAQLQATDTDAAVKYDQQLAALKSQAKLAVSIAVASLIAAGAAIALNLL